MAKPGVRIDGLAGLLRAFDAIDPRVSGAVNSSTEKSAHAVRERYGELAPRDTGALAEAPFVRPYVGVGQSGHEVVIDRDRLVEDRRNRGGAIGHDAQRNEDAFYAAYVEFGEGGNRPFRQSLADVTNAAVADLRKEVRAGLEAATR